MVRVDDGRKPIEIPLLRAISVPHAAVQSVLWRVWVEQRGWRSELVWSGRPSDHASSAYFNSVLLLAICKVWVNVVALWAGWVLWRASHDGRGLPVVY